MHATLLPDSIAFSLPRSSTTTKLPAYCKRILILFSKPWEHISRNQVKSKKGEGIKPSKWKNSGTQKALECYGPPETYSSPAKRLNQEVHESITTFWAKRSLPKHRKPTRTKETNKYFSTISKTSSLQEKKPFLIHMLFWNLAGNNASEFSPCASIT